MSKIILALSMKESFIQDVRKEVFFAEKLAENVVILSEKTHCKLEILEVLY